MCLDSNISSLLTVSMAQYMTVLQQYIAAGQVSLSSMAVTGFDDVAGLGGLKLADAYADVLFLNQVC